MKAFVCKVCAYVSINGSAPDKCPVCGSPKTAFEEKENAINTPKDAANLTDAEKKHTPVILVVKKCGLIPEGCQDVHAKVGQIQHPMQAEHSIQHIDFYIDKEFISRAILTPEKLNAAAALHLKPGGGKISVVELCNLHGAWTNEVGL